VLGKAHLQLTSLPTFKESQKNSGFRRFGRNQKAKVKRQKSKMKEEAPWRNQKAKIKNEKRKLPGEIKRQKSKGKNQK